MDTKRFFYTVHFAVVVDLSRLDREHAHVILNFSSYGLDDGGGEFV